MEEDYNDFHDGDLSNHQITKQWKQKKYLNTFGLQQS
jgi:hypothetical protein